MKDINASVSIDKNGEIIFSKKENVVVQPEYITSINQFLKEIEKGIYKEDTIFIEKKANEIVILCDQIKADELKNAAFKIELAARRENLQQIVETVIKLKKLINDM